MPSGDHAHAFTESVCPVRVRVGWPVAASHTLAVRSPLAVARRVPSGDHAHAFTRWVSQVSQTSSAPSRSEGLPTSDPGDSGATTSPDVCGANRWSGASRQRRKRGRYP